MTVDSLNFYLDLISPVSGTFNLMRKLASNDKLPVLQAVFFVTIIIHLVDDSHRHFLNQLTTS